MNCGRVSNQLSAYLDRELTGVEMLQIRRHLTECDRCRSEHEALSRLKMMLGRLQSLEPPQGFVGDTVHRFELSGARPHRAAPWAKGAPRFSAIARLLTAPKKLSLSSQPSKSSSNTAAGDSSVPQATTTCGARTVTFAVRPCGSDQVADTPAARPRSTRMVSARQFTMIRAPPR